MGAFERVLARLHRVFNREPQGVPAIVVTKVNTLVTIRHFTVIMTVVTAEGQPTSETTIDIGPAAGSPTIDALAVLLVAEGFTVEVKSGFGGMPAMSLLESAEGNATNGLALSAPTSIFYNEMRTCGWELDLQQENIRSAERQMYMHSAEDFWLDYWCRDHFGSPRLEGEADKEYYQRVVAELVRENQNNIALELIVKKGMGIDITLHDAYPLRAQLPVEYQEFANARFILDMIIPGELSEAEGEELITRIKALVRRHKSAGTDFIEGGLIKKVPRTEKITVSETIILNFDAAFTETLSPGPIFYGAGWVYGTPGLVYGNNDAIKEQISVKTILAADDSVVSREILGG